MKLSRKLEYCFRNILLIITISACIGIVGFTFLRQTGREKDSETQTVQENSFSSEKLKDEKCIPVCYSRSCIKQADLLLRSIDPSNDPCEDFQKFLCGSYAQKAGRYENKTMLHDMTDVIMNKAKNIIENIKAEPGSAAEKMKIVYDSCVNLGSELHGVENFKQVLNSVGIVNWPYLAADFKFTDTDLPNLLATLKAYGQINFLAFHIELTSEDHSNKLVKVIFNSIFNNTPAIPKNALTDVLNYFDMEQEDVETILNDYSNIRNSLINFSEESALNADSCEENCSDKHIDCSSFENNEWENVCQIVQIFLNVLNLSQFIEQYDVSISGYQVINIKYLIPRLKSLPDRSVANYFAVNMLWNNLDKLNFFFLRKKQKYFDYFKTEDKPFMPESTRWKYCVNWISESMNIALENELVKNYFTTTSVDEIHDFHQSFTSAVNEMIDHQVWISDPAKYFMKDHIQNLDCNMVLIKNLLPNDTYVNTFFEKFNPSPTNFFHNTLDYMKNLMNTVYRSLSKHERWHGPTLTANAETHKESKDFVLHYGMFVPPTYYPGHEKFIKLITLAPIMIHEIGHHLVFLLDLVSMTSNETKDVFYERKQCIENQFSKFNFTLIDENLNGTIYFDENLSDNLGFAFTDRIIDELESSEDIFSLPGLPYSPKQLLYMSTRQIFCSKTSRKLQIHHKTDKHPPQKYRIIGTLQNSKGYSETFSCPEGSYMNPSEKCTFLDSV